MTHAFIGIYEEEGRRLDVEAKIAKCLRIQVRRLKASYNIIVSIYYKGSNYRIIRKNCRFT